MSVEKSDFAKTEGGVPASPPPAYEQTAPGYDQPGYDQPPPTGYAQVPPTGGYVTPQGQVFYPTTQGQPMYTIPPGNVQYVMAPQAQTMNVPPGAQKDYFNEAIFVTLCCFWPTGILAISKASNARAALARGDVASAHTYSQSARQMIKVSIIAGILSIIVTFVLLGIYVGLLMNI